MPLGTEPTYRPLQWGSNCGQYALAWLVGLWPGYFMRIRGKGAGGIEWGPYLLCWLGFTVREVDYASAEGWYLVLVCWYRKTSYGGKLRVYHSMALRDGILYDPWPGYQTYEVRRIWEVLK